MSIDATPDETVKYQSSTSDKGQQQMDSDDRTLVWRVRDNEATLTIEVSGGEEDRTDTYKASGLTLEKEG